MLTLNPERKSVNETLRIVQNSIREVEFIMQENYGCECNCSCEDTHYDYLAMQQHEEYFLFEWDLIELEKLGAD